MFPVSDRWNVYSNSSKIYRSCKGKENFRGGKIKMDYDLNLNDLIVVIYVLLIIFMVCNEALHVSPIYGSRMQCFIPDVCKTSLRMDYHSLFRTHSMRSYCCFIPSRLTFTVSTTLRNCSSFLISAGFMSFSWIFRMSVRKSRCSNSACRLPI